VNAVIFPPFPPFFFSQEMGQQRLKMYPHLLTPFFANAVGTRITLIRVLLLLPGIALQENRRKEEMLIFTKPPFPLFSLKDGRSFIESTVSCTDPSLFLAFISLAELETGDPPPSPPPFHVFLGMIMGLYPQDLVFFPPPHSQVMKEMALFSHLLLDRADGDEFVLTTPSWSSWISLTVAGNWNDKGGFPPFSLSDGEKGRT